MFVVAIAIVASGLHLFGDGVGAAMDKLTRLDPNLAKVVNPDSTLFGSFFSVFVSGFVIGFAVVAQPHSKAIMQAKHIQRNRITGPLPMGQMHSCFNLP
jgi:Na+/pantothenate symporter